MTGPWSKYPHQPRNMLLMRATVLLGSSAYHWRVVRWWIRLSRLFTDFRDGRVPIYGRPFLPWKRPTVFGPVLGEDLCAGLADGFVASRSRLSQQGLELGEDLLDRIEIGRVFRQKDEARPDVADRSSHGLSLVGAEIVEDHDVAWFEGGCEELFDIEHGAF